MAGSGRPGRSRSSRLGHGRAARAPRNRQDRPSTLLWFGYPRSAGPGMLHLHALACGVIEGPQRCPGWIRGITNPHGPLALVEVALADRLVGIDHRQADRAAERESVRR